MEKRLSIKHGQPKLAVLDAGKQWLKRYFF